MKILITGGTGLVGQELGLALAREGAKITVISRNKEHAVKSCPYPCEVIAGDLSQSPVQGLADRHFDVVYHLVGDSVAQGRWTDEKKIRLRNSRIAATQNLKKSLKSISTLVAVSAIGYYGEGQDRLLDESQAAGSDFLAQLCVDWEKAISELAEVCERSVIYRLGVVITEQGGALKEMLTPFKYKIGGPLGSGKNWMSWVHLQDVVQAFLAAKNNQSMRGIYNLVAPGSVTNAEFTQKLAEVWHVPAFMPTPTFALKIAFGEKSQILLSSQRVSAEKLLATGFKFRFPHLHEALLSEYSDRQPGEERFVARQFIAKPLGEVFEFFSEAKNLERITPEFLNFKIETMSTEKIQEGTEIVYTLKIHGVPVRWKTLIREWKPPQRFNDLQLKGPYSVWDHTHLFEEIPGGTLVTDAVKYKLPLGFLGFLVAGAFVKKDVQSIFAHRVDTIYKLMS